METSVMQSRPPRSAVFRVFVALAIFAFAASSLVFGAGYLEIALPGGLPLGNLLSAVGLVSLAYAAVVLSVPSTTARAFARLAAALAMFWLPASVFLAGNLALNFQGKAGSIWLTLSAATLLASSSALLWAAGQRLARSFRRQSFAGAA